MITREEWLNNAVAALGTLFEDDVPPVHVSVGFPSTRGLSNTRRRIGECWSSEASEDGKPHIFISPLLNDGVEVLSTLAHEMVHALVGGEAKHGAKFGKVARAIGLTGKMTATVAGPEMIESLNLELGKLGSYPHVPLNPGARPTKKQTTRLLKTECPECGYLARVTMKWIEEAGPPICPVDEVEFTVVLPEDKEDS